MKEIGYGCSKVLGRKVLPFCLFIFSLFTLCALSGCIEEYEADISADDSDLLVVEGAICASSVNTFVLSRTQSIKSLGTPRMVTGAIVSVRGSDGSEYTAQENDGSYSCRIGALSPDATYFLHIETDGEVYESEPQKPLPTEEIAEVMGMQDTPESNIDVLVTPDDPFEPGKVNYYSWTYEETWEVHPDYTTTVFFDITQMTCIFKPFQFPERGWKSAVSPTIMASATNNYEGNHIQRLKLYDIDRSNERLYYKYSGLVHQRALSKAEYEYELARRQAGSEMGGLFTPLPSALPTNIHCLTSGKHVIGYVGCALNVAEYRFFFTPADFSVDGPPYIDGRIWLENCNEEDCARMVKNGLFLCEWEDDRFMPGGQLRTAWAYNYQLDVRCRGAFIEEPDYWSSN